MKRLICVLICLLGFLATSQSAMAQSADDDPDRNWSRRYLEHERRLTRQPSKPTCPPPRVIYVDRPVYVPVYQPQWRLIGWDYHPTLGVWTPRYVLQ